ncbi:ATP-binding cassette domain-containing protein [Gallaecimonas xiamenensis]|uniref:Sodium ABC exporter ATP-binding protein n=1 Tax=Gallaecimonas xiamenensis 3-C-1 TaxID=745411 RepID=K2KH98_9GAMM|nr:ATP-binding cassette domain-containing protein [Gallaecimonas xiamenensis]EKE76635.1 sodium ABC exporter ATP-binding protein [Gallaecimonas xiamenensis 3-C-1]
MIEVKGLAKRFAVTDPKKLTEEEKADPRLQGRFFHSVRQVEFSCQQGEVLALLGPNGAGKTTTLRMLSSAIKPDAGTIEIGGIDVVRDPAAARKKIGFLSSSTGLYGRLTAMENVAYFGRMHGLEGEALAERMDSLFSLLDMKSFLHRRAEQMSSGMKQRTSIARALVHNPQVVILDEPTTGLDIMATETVLSVVRHLKSQGVPVIFSTHHLDEVAALCDRVAVIDRGETVFNDSLAQFAALNGDLRQALLTLVMSKEAA